MTYGAEEDGSVKVPEEDGAVDRGTDAEKLAFALLAMLEGSTLRDEKPEGAPEEAFKSELEDTVKLKLELL